MANERFFGDGFFGDVTAGMSGTVPSRPTISVAIAGSVATVTVDGAVGVINQVIYQAINAGAWTAADPRAGDGDVVISGLVPGTRYVFLCYSILDGVPSVQSDSAYAAATVQGAQTPTGAVGIAVGKLREMFAESATLQSDIGAVGDAAAKKAFALTYVHSSEYRPGAFAYPMILISRTGNDSHQTAGRPATLPAGTFEVMVHREIPSGLRTSSQDADIELDNFASDVVAEVLDKSDAAGYLLLRSISVSDGPYRFEKEELADVAGVTLQVEYGLAG